MDSQSSFVHRFILWGLAWIVILSLLAGLVLWKAPFGAAEGTATQSYAAPFPSQTIPEFSYPLYFPLLFNNGQPSLQAVP